MSGGWSLHWGGRGSLPGGRAGDGASHLSSALDSEVRKHLAWLQEVGKGPLGPECCDHETGTGGVSDCESRAAGSRQGTALGHSRRPSWQHAGPVLSSLLGTARHHGTQLPPRGHRQPVRTPRPDACAPSAGHLPARWAKAVRGQVPTRSSPRCPGPGTALGAGRRPHITHPDASFTSVTLRLPGPQPSRVGRPGQAEARPSWQWPAGWQRRTVTKVQPVGPCPLWAEAPALHVESGVL